MSGTNSKLMLHAGGKKATRDDVFAIEAPPPTQTWHPQPHRNVLCKVEEVLQAAGYAVTRQELALSHHGNRFFGVVRHDG